MNVADDSESRPTYNSAEATDGPIFFSQNMEMHSFVLIVVTLSSLARETCKPIEVQDRKVVYLSISINEEVVQKEKLAGELEDMMKLKLVSELEDKVYIH